MHKSCCISLYISPNMLFIHRLLHAISIHWTNWLNQHLEPFSHNTLAKLMVPVQETEELHFDVTNLTSDQMLQSYNHVCATEFLNLSMTSLNASGPITEPNWICSAAPPSHPSPPYPNPNKIGGEKWIQQYSVREKKKAGDTSGGGVGGVGLGRWIILRLYKYTDVLTNTHPDTYTQSHLFQSCKRMGSGKWQREREGGSEGEVGPRFLITPLAYLEDIPIR